MILPIHRLVRARMAEAVSRLYSIPADDPVLAAIPVEAPPRRALGDLAVPLAFELARRLRKAPRVIAQEIAAALGTVEGFSRIEAAPNGYVNFFLDRPAFAQAVARAAARPPRRRATARPSSSTRPSTRTRRRTSAICATPRSATRSDGCSGSSAARSRSRTTSTTPASRSPTSPSASASWSTRRSTTSARSPTPTRFDYYCWDLYARVTEWYEADKTRLKIRAAALHDIEHGGNDTADIAALHRRPHRPRHLKTMRAHEHRLRPAHLGRRHPAPALLGARVRVPEEDRRRVPADRRQAEGLLGHADRRDGGETARPRPRGHGTTARPETPSRG